MPTEGPTGAQSAQQSSAEGTLQDLGVQDQDLPDNFTGLEGRAGGGEVGKGGHRDHSYLRGS